MNDISSPHLKGHASLAEMISTHIENWRCALKTGSLKHDALFLQHELKALDDIEQACKVELNYD